MLRIDTLAETKLGIVSPLYIKEVILDLSIILGLILRPFVFQP